MALQQQLLIAGAGSEDSKAGKINANSTELLYKNKCLYKYMYSTSGSRLGCQSSKPHINTVSMPHTYMLILI